MIDELGWIFSKILVRRVPKGMAKCYLSRLILEFAYLHHIKSIPSIKNVYEIVRLTHKYPQIPYFVRGSANSSILCYLIGITHIDSITYRVNLARFVNNTRKDLPDIDMDFPAHQRDEMFKRIHNHFRGRVARISNKVYFRQRSALRQAIRNNGIHKFFDKYENPMEQVPSEVRCKVIQESRELVDTFHYYSLHCGGIIIFPEEIHKKWLLPRPSASKPCNGSLPQLTIDKYDVDKEGLFKIDILSNRAFTTLLNIHTRDLREYPERDLKTAKQLAESVIGITLAESSLIGYLCRRYRPKSRYELALVLSLARPAASNIRRLKTDDIKRMRQLEDIIIFDDDAINYISDIIDCSPDEADRYRKIFAKNNQDEIQKFKRLLRSKGYSITKRRRIISKLSTLRQYGFCKGHALALSYLVWALAYCKAHYPKSFWLSVLNNNNTEWRPWVYYRCAITEGGLDISLPDAILPGRWTLSGNNLCKSSVRQTLISDYFEEGKIDQSKAGCYHRFGFWRGLTFLSNMYFNSKTCPEDKNKDEIEIRGLIGRVKFDSNSDYITIFINNHQSYDCALNKIKSKSSLNTEEGSYHLFDVLEGWGFRSKRHSQYNQHITIRRYTMYQLT
jgi:DNA polymerase III alpha subunit